MIDLVSRFSGVNLGVSVETLDRVNDYVRWPSRIESVQQTLSNWLDLAREQAWTTTIRITPTILTIDRLSQVYQFALEHDTSIESCNFLYRPRFMRATVLPQHLRHEAADRLAGWIAQHQQGPQQQIINTRSPDLSRAAVLQDASSYVHYLRTAPDETELLPELAAYLTDMDRLRGLDLAHYLPEHAELLRTHGYRSTTS